MKRTPNSIAVQNLLSLMSKYEAVRITDWDNPNRHSNVPHRVVYEGFNDLVSIDYIRIVRAKVLNLEPIVIEVNGLSKPILCIDICTKEETY